MDEEADISRAEAGDALDFLIAESLLEFEEDDIPLVGGESVEKLSGACQAFFEFDTGIGLEAGVRDMIPLAFFKRLDAFIFSEEVECPVAADGEEP